MNQAWLWPFLGHIVLVGCGGEAGTEDDEAAGAGGGGATVTATGSTAASGAAGGCADCDVPTGADLPGWLEDGGYLAFEAESAPHPSAGPHFGSVRTFINPLLADSLAQGSSVHPAGAATVKELYGDGAEVRGHAVWVKLADDSAAGQNLYWYEKYDGSVFADGSGVSLCTGCHGEGNDFFRGGYPLP